MLIRYGQAAILAALATLMGNVVWAQQFSNPGYYQLFTSSCCFHNILFRRDRLELHQTLAFQASCKRRRL